MDANDVDKLNLQAQENNFTLQYFGTNAEDCSDVIFNQCIKNFSDLIPETINSLENCFPGVYTQDEINNCLQQFIQRFYRSLELNSDIFHKYCKQYIFNIPRGTLLPMCAVQKHYAEQKLVCDSENSVDAATKLEQKTSETKESIRELKFENSARRQHLAELEKLEKSLDSFNSKLTEVETFDLFFEETFESVKHLNQCMKSVQN
uniref:uncharacterized protein LOC100187039 n=1 Tax=Ciona intestinalis TaxID=7719 RepID=UPI000180C864|nr:uncharacterized protein LOC100187039 [Ciona intestinalis]|eukprot:XP_002128567.1 uncharacterized protein LOC100187039 [Ciona intestinalis]